MAWRFHNAVPYAIPGILALLSCWWMYSHRKKHASCCDELATAMGQQQEEVTENDLLPQTEAHVPQRLPLSSEEESSENETSTSLLSVGLMTPSLLCQTHERQDVSQDFSDLSVTTMQPSTLEDDSEKLETIGSQDESSVPACVTLPPVSESMEHHGSAAESFPRDWSSTANQDQWPSVAVTLTEEPPGITEQISNAEQSDESSFKPPKELQMPESVLSNAGSVTALCLGLEKEANTPQVCLSDEVVSSHKNSAVSMLQDSSESASLEQSREEEMSESLVSTVPVCQEEDTQLKGDELEREKIGGASLEKEEDEKTEQVAMQIISKVTLAATEELLSGSTSGMSTQICQAAASLVERPLEVASVVSSDLMPAKEAPAAEEKVAKEKVTVTSDPAALRTGEQGQSVADASCSPGPAQGGTGHCRVKSCMCSKSPGAGRTPGKNRRGSLKKVLLVTEDSGVGTHMSEGGTSVEGSLQNTELSVASGQLLDWLSMSVTQDVSGEQSSVPSEEPSGALELPKDRKVPYSNGTLKEDGPHLYYECRWATATDGDHSQGLDENSVDSVDSGNAMKKTVTHQKLQGESSKSDFVIWEIEVPQELVGRLIGKQGRFMSFLRQASGAKIYVSTPPYFSDSQVCHIEGSMHQVEKVLRIIGKKFKELCLTNIYAVPPPAPLTLHSLLRTTWLLLPDGVTVEVVVANQVDAGHMFLQQHTHPTFHVLRILDQQMYTCYSQPEIPTLTIPVEVGIICAAPGLDGAWLRAQVTKYFKETNEVELKYVDYGGYDKVKVDTLRQIRSDFLSLPFQGAEVFLDNVVPLSDEDCFSSEANATVSEMTRGAVLVAQVTNYDSATGLPLIQLWNLMGGEVVSVNRTLVERGFARWLDY